ncbi:MAG: 1-deoxy-D-xylulose-5-phosphate synthase [Candidatus Zixiibacteriota bacterium]
MSEAILENIHGPQDVWGLTYGELKTLADELREEIISVVSDTGGHLAPNLGIIELTLAVLKVFKPEKDRIVWDVGHQCYPYKILTGRRDKFCTIRCHEGISGFPKRSESPCDHFGVGHASTSISAAVGFAQARDMRGQDHNVVAIIGDGALTGGIAYEALNNGGSYNSEMLIILNDNKMSISRNVGAMSKYLTSIIANPHYSKLKEDVWQLMGKIPIGSSIRSLAAKIEDSLKNIIVPGMLFEQLGWEYFGPIDGHDTHKIVSVLREIKNVRKPKILHLLTEKGKGYSFAEENRPKFHGIGSFDKKTGEKHSSTGIKSYTQVFGETMVELGAKMPELTAITAAMSLGTGLVEFSEKYPNRFYDVGIAEPHATTFATALALEGIPVVCAIYSTFLQRSYDQLIHDAALQDAPVVFALDRGGVVGADGPTHHGVFDLSYLRTIPKMIVAAPADESELRDLLYTGIKYQKGPYAMRYPRGKGIGVKEFGHIEEIEIGSWQIKRKGDKKLTILATGSMVNPAVDAAEDGLKEIKPTVINCRFIKPMDEKLLEEVALKADYIITVEENARQGGFGEGVMSWLLDHGYCGKMEIMAIPDEFVPHGNTNILLKNLLLDKSGITETAKKLVNQ